MKIFAIQKTPPNTYAPQFNQNSSVNQNPVAKTNQAGDKFVSKTSFGANVDEMEQTIAKLEKRLDTEKLADDVREALMKQIRRLKTLIEWEADEGGGATDSAAQRAIDNYIP